MKRISLLCCAALSSMVLSATARAADAPDNITRLAFTTEAQSTGTPTHLTVRLSGHAVNTSAAQAQQALNRQMEAAMKAASSQDGVTAHAGAYDMTQDAPEHGASRWNATQDMTLEGADSVTLLHVAGQLQQQGLALDGLDWSLDPQLRTKLLRQAREEALRKVRQEAQTDAEALGLHFVSLENVRINGSDPMPRSMMLMSARMASAPMAPQSSPEDQTLRVNVSVEARLSP